MSNVNASLAKPPASANVTWDSVSPSSLSPPVSGYQVVYHLVSSTIVQFKNVSLAESQTTLTGLQDSERYEIYVRLVCSGVDGGVGQLSEPVNLTLVDASEFRFV